MAASDVTFTFDEAPFMKGLEKVSSGISGVVKKLAILGASYLSIRAIASKIPEIGQTFSIAGDIMLRNFLEPLRTWLIPMLMSMLDWVRKNREVFVKAGVVFSNVFRALFVVIKQVIELIKVLWNSLTGFLTETFGKVAGDTSQLFNMIIFKLATIFIFMGELLRPVFQLIGRIVGFAIAAIGKFIQGFMKGFKPIAKILGEIWDVVADFFGEITSGNKTTKTLLKIFMDLGEIFARWILIPLQMIKTALVLVVSLVRGLAEGFWNAIGGEKGWNSIKKTVMDIYDTIVRVIKKYETGLKPVFKFLGEVIGATIGLAVKGVLWTVQQIVSLFEKIVNLVTQTIKSLELGFSKMTDFEKTITKNLLIEVKTGKLQLPKELKALPSGLVEVMFQKAVMDAVRRLKLDSFEKIKKAIEKGEPFGTEEFKSLPGKTSMVTPGSTTAKAITIGKVEVKIDVSGAGDTAGVATSVMDKFKTEFLKEINHTWQAVGA